VPADFPYEILDVVSHRPWPMPESRWLMTQSWHDLLFAHWPVDHMELRALVPAALPLDLFDGQAWVGVVPFHMTNVVPRGVPALPGVSAFPELNVRTYVRVQDKPGVYFFSLDATSALAVKTARTLFGLPYFTAEMEVGTEGDWVLYRSHRPPSSHVDGSGQAPRSERAEFVARYRPIGSAYAPVPGTLDHFLTERYCLYTASGAPVRRLEIHHPPWPLQAAEAIIERNTMAAACGIRVPAMAPLLHFAKRQDMVAFAPHEVR
jgi:uncharacterized protein YqjF (DUF2071 family)